MTSAKEKKNSAHWIFKVHCKLLWFCGEFGMIQCFELIVSAANFSIVRSQTDQVGPNLLSLAQAIFVQNSFTPAAQHRVPPTLL